MDPTALLVAAAAAFAWAVVARRLNRTMLTGPMIFLALGLALGGGGLGEGSRATLEVLAEVTLVAVLFADASRLDAVGLIRDRRRPLRMLLIGLPLAVLLGTGAAWALLPAVTLAGAAVMAAVMAPTDAALGEAVITNPRVPKRLRAILAAESGLNDGLALPLILFLASLVVGEGVAGQGEGAPNGWLAFALRQIGLGVAIGAVLGGVGGWITERARAAGLSGDDSLGVAALALAGACYFAADVTGGNGFIAAFCGGLAFGAAHRGRGGFAAEFMENQGRSLVLISFLLIGAGLLPDAIAAATAGQLVFVLVALLLVRPLAIAAALRGTGTGPATTLFFGWFGPRGLATALFALIVVEGVMHEAAAGLLNTAVLAVAASTLLHGLTAAPAARLLGPVMAREERTAGRGADPDEDRAEGDARAAGDATA